MFGLVFGLTFGFATRQTSLVKLTELALTPCGWLAPCISCACWRTPPDRQVLRRAGAVYQFRHAALQDHLAAVYYQGRW